MRDAVDQEVVDRLLRWFNGRRSVPPLSWEEHASANYAESGWIDSFGVVELVEDLEHAFAIRFTEQDMNDPEFATIGGLARIVSRRRVSA